MTPSEIETFHGNETQIALAVHHFEEPMSPTFWVHSGIAAFQVNEDELRELADLLTSYKEEELDFNLPISKTKKILAGVILALIVGLSIGVVLYV